MSPRLVLAAAALGVAIPATPAGTATIGNGDKIAFATRSGIRVVNADGSGRTTNVTGSRGAIAPVWSPDGSHLAFAIQGEFGARSLAVVRANGSGRRTVASGGALIIDPAWSPDGSRIAFSRFGSGLYVVHPDGTGETRLTTGGFGPAWAPDGSRLAFASGDKLYVIDSDGSDSRLIAGPRAASPAWSPDGGRIAFLSVENLYLGFCCAGAIHVVNADGTGLRKVSPVLSYPSAPRWSPDGGKLLAGSSDYGLLAGIPHPSGPGRIAVFAADGSGDVLARQTGYAPSWSPDGTRMVFMRWTGRGGGVAGLFAAGADGSCATWIADVARDDEPGSPAWQPLAGVPPQVPAGCPDLSIHGRGSQRGPTTVHDAIRVAFGLTNRGNRTATSVTVRVELPGSLKRPRASLAGVACRIAARSARCSIRELPRLKPVELVVTGLPGRPGRYSFTATASASADGDRSNNEASQVASALRCTITGSAAADALRGTARRDRICGLGGADRLLGLAGGDQLIGHGGADLLDGGPGKDTLWGGSGPDVLDANDDTTDVVICGAGADRVLADADDVVADDCERVARSAA